MKDKLYADKTITVWGLDLGSSCATLMAGEFGADGTLHILGVEQEQARGLVSKGLLANSAEAAMTIVRLVKQLKNRLQLSDFPRHIYISIGGKGLRVTQSDVRRSLPTKHVSNKLLREMEQECKDKLEKAYPNFDVIEVIWDSFVLDGDKEVLDPTDQKATDIEGQYEIYYGQSPIRRRWEECVAKQDIFTVPCYFSSCEALRRALLDDSVVREGAAIIDFGAETTTYCAYYDGQLLDMTVVPFGSYNITKDIAYQAIKESDAEKLKKRFTHLIPQAENTTIRVKSATDLEKTIFYDTTTLTNIAVAREDEIIEKIVERINENIGKLQDKPIFICGGGARQKGIADFLQDRIDMRVQIGNIENLSADTDEKFLAPEYARIIGTLMLGYDFSKNNAEQSTIENKKQQKTKKGLFNTLVDLFQDNADLQKE